MEINAHAGNAMGLPAEGIRPYMAALKPPQKGDAPRRLHELSRMNSEDHSRSIIPLPEASLAIAGAGGGEKRAEMNAELLAVARGPLHKIGEIELCDPDYRQIRLWADALALEPEEVIRRLLDTRSLRYEERDASPVTCRVFEETTFKQGRILKLNWDFDLLPCSDFRWVDGLEIEYLRIVAQPPPLSPTWQKLLHRAHSQSIEGCNWYEAWRTLPNKISTLRLALPKLQILICHRLLLDAIDLSRVPLLEILGCSWNRLKHLDLSDVPELKELDCSWNRLKSIELHWVPQLLSLDCSCNLLDGIFFDEAEASRLERLMLTGNYIETLDIRPLANLKFFEGSDEQEDRGRGTPHCKVVQRPDQHFQ